MTSLVSQWGSVRSWVADALGFHLLRKTLREINP